MSHTDLIIHQYLGHFLLKGEGKDFEWLKKAQGEKYKKAFDLTKYFIKDIESVALNISLEHSRIPSLTGNSLLWTILIPINVAVISVTIYDWGNLSADVGKYAAWIFFLSFFCIIVEVVAYLISSPTEGNVNLINRLKTQWEFILANNLDSDDAYKQIELFITFERSANYRKLMKTPTGAFWRKYLPVGLQFLMTAAIIAMAGNILRDKSIVDKNAEKKVLVCSAEHWKDDSPKVICKKQELPQN